ncbi:sodium:calcium antiporter [Ilumatobacter coccineus]|jgi:cation:H+ antiporter|uniref:Putative transporter n=1 Tax=Ilumatobacter coccineus (strain NBRC 103263 / KCTC 29153 / YM16-304) TaxID=1313172 RepID=A0A6C7EHR3_ILUCY|nr:transporter [Ilumatobacter coccineus]BAN03516.1 putative transporter [Ilumatobacter coccineus YM16-304]
MIALWIVAFVGGLVTASLASRRAVTHALAVADGSRVSSGFIGMTVLAIGTDLPEIANSIISAATGHGDLNVGDSAGSAMTQVTLVLGILCFGVEVVSDRRAVAALGILTATALGVISLLVRDGVFDRVDGLLLVASWVLALIAMRSLVSDSSPPAQPGSRIGPAIALTAVWLVVVAVAATVVVQSFVAITESIGVPEILAGAVVLALGTSLPELIVDWTAVRRGAGALALGDLFGSSFLDATFAVGIGPALTPTVVSSAATATCIVAGLGIIAATAIAATRPTLRRGSAVALVGVYGVATVALIAATG